MKKSQFTKEQIALALSHAEAGTPIVEVCRKMGVSEQALCRWNKQFAGMGVAELRRLKQFAEESCKLKTLVADRTMYNQILWDALKGKPNLRCFASANNACVRGRDGVQGSE
jgi:putative transposase